MTTEDEFEANVSRLLARLTGNKEVMALLSKDSKATSLIDSIEAYYESKV